MNRSLQSQLQCDMIRCRERTLSLFQGLDYQTFSAQAHPEFSPVGWHLGHIAYIWDYWILGKWAGLALTTPNYEQLFAVDGLAKADRVKLPQLDDVFAYFNLIGDRLLAYLESSSLFAEEEKIWRWLIQHESQHAETIAIILQIQDQLPQAFQTQIAALTRSPQDELSLITIPAGYFMQGNNELNAMDNESSAHRVYVDTFRIASHPVSQGQYQNFINLGGYRQEKWWTKAGWQWVQSQQVTKPLYWQIFGDDPRSPVCGINWYEAEAYSRFIGMRLPTESEWEKAATYAGDRLALKGKVWEWTSTLFHPYPNFLPFPYTGYSSLYFDDQHYVLKGGSWASSEYTWRSPFRNWYQPHVRQIFAGLRCVEI